MEQRAQAGLRAVHTYRPCRISQWWALRLNSRGVERSRPSSTARGVLPRARQVRLATRNIWVSTAIAGTPNGGVHHHVRGLAPDARQALQRLGLRRHLSSMALDEEPAGRNHAFRLGVEQADGPYVHPRRGFDPGPGGVGRLSPHAASSNPPELRDRSSRRAVLSGWVLRCISHGKGICSPYGLIDHSTSRSNDDCPS